MKEELYILLIEDSEVDAELIERELGRENYQLKIRRVQTKQELTEALDQTMPDLILSDYSLPAFSAPDALQIIVEKAPQIPVIIVSGTIGEERAIEVLKSGATDYVLKDRITRLIPAVQRALREAQQQAEKKRAEEYLRLLEKAIENMQLGVTVTDLTGRIIYTNAAEARMHGYKVQDLIGKDARIFAPRELWKTMMTDDLREIRSWRRESTNIRDDGTIFPVQITSDVVGNPEGKPIGIVSICEDITERKRAQDAFYDTLTSLPNRALFMDRLSRALKRIKRRHDYLFAILLLNLDRFKIGRAHV